MSSVFVGNIPAKATECQLIDVFQTAGKVKSLKIIYNQETGNTRGFAFCEYEDKETAESAIRNLNHVEIDGRNLSVRLATRYDNTLPNTTIGSRIGPSHPSTMKHLNHLMEVLPKVEFKDMFSDMQAFITRDPQGARAFLHDCPEVAYAFSQIYERIFKMDPAIRYSLHNQDAPPLAIIRTEPAKVVAQLNDKQRNILAKVMAMSPEQISVLSPQLQQSVYALQNNMRGV